MTEIDGPDIHFIHVKSQHAKLPLIMSHGWPGSIIELLGRARPRPRTTARCGTCGRGV